VLRRLSILLAKRFGVEVLIPSRDDLHARNPKRVERNGIEGIRAHWASVYCLALDELRKIFSEHIGQCDATPAITHRIGDAGREPPDMRKIIARDRDLAPTSDVARRSQRLPEMSPPAALQAWCRHWDRRSAR
jgi:hypothetical protein